MSLQPIPNYEIIMWYYSRIYSTCMTDAFKLDISSFPVSLCPVANSVKTRSDTFFFSSAAIFLMALTNGLLGVTCNLIVLVPYFITSSCLVKERRGTAVETGGEVETHSDGGGKILGVVYRLQRTIIFFIRSLSLAHNTRVNRRRPYYTTGREAKHIQMSRGHQYHSLVVREVRQLKSLQKLAWGWWNEMRMSKMRI